MPNRLLPRLLLSFTAMTAIGAVAAPALKVDDALLANQSDGRNWAAYGRTYAEDHASPLRQIDTNNIQRLGLAWSLELPGITNAATVPLAVDGVVYFTVGQSLVHAVDVRTGKLLWRYDPQVTRVAGRKLRITWGPRGIAFYEGRVYVGTTDGRLIAIDAKTGKEDWSVLTVDKDDLRTVTGPPRVFRGLVIIGHAGSEWSNVRGYVTAYDARTGQQRWRFYTAPGNPADGFEDETQAMAAKTWTGEWWKFGGGATVWNAITYDPKYDRVYLGTGNGGPWNRNIRSPGGGDNLFVCSIVALDAKTGKYVWHYQTVPGESWDYNSAMDITLARMRIGGTERDVIMHAPKNGFFYLIDRKDGRLLSAEKFGKATWAERIDMTTGRPVEAAGARYETEPALLFPGGIGVHNWQPMSYNAARSLVFIPTVTIAGLYSDKGIDRVSWHQVPAELNTGLLDFTADAPPDAGSSALIAWDPLRQKQVWSVTTPGIWNGGTLATASDLVFQGQADGQFNAYEATSGRRVWSFDAKMGISGAPITYEVDGRQYVTVVAGWGGAAPAFFGSIGAQHGWQARVHPHRVLTFVLDGKAQLPPTPAPSRAVPVDDPTLVLNTEWVSEGETLYARRCSACHGLTGVAGGFAPDLRASPVGLTADAFDRVVRLGALELNGMPKFDELTAQQVEALRHYLRKRARSDIQTEIEVRHLRKGAGKQ